MKNYEIWTEGYAATGESSPAILLGKADGISFKDACENFAKNNSEFKKDFNPNCMTYWGCRLFDNYYDAKKSYG